MTQLSNPEKAAVIWQNLSPDNIAKLSTLLTKEELEKLNELVSKLGEVDPESMEQIINDLNGEVLRYTSGGSTTVIS